MFKELKDRRSIDLGVKVSQAEEQSILDKAKLLSMSKSEYVRFCCLNAKIEIVSKEK
jgi:hypothetical protein